MGDVLQHYCLARARRRHDDRPLALAERGNQINNPGRQILSGGIIEFELKFLLGVKRRQIVKIDPLTQTVGLVEIYSVDFEQCEVALTIARRADLSFDRVARTQSKAPDLARANINIV